MQSTDRGGYQVGRYVIYGELASGGMATVHLGRLRGPAGFSRTVAIKRLHEHLASEPEFITMLVDEAKLVSSSHPRLEASKAVPAPTRAAPPKARVASAGRPKPRGLAGMEKLATKQPEPSLAAAPAASASCNLPYRIDELGIRRIRRECL
jgi:hypothetical protein